MSIEKVKASDSDPTPSRSNFLGRTSGILAGLAIGARVGYWAGDRLMSFASVGRGLPARVLEHTVESMFTVSGAIMTTAIAAFILDTRMEQNQGTNTNTSSVPSAEVAPVISPQELRQFQEIIDGENWN